jgi:hypothetical protein
MPLRQEYAEAVHLHAYFYGSWWLMDTPLRQEYAEAVQLLKDFKICGNGNISTDEWKGSGCGEVFKTEEVKKTVSHGQTYYWCCKCYESIKDE